MSAPRILVVEDEEDMLLMLRLNLEVAGFAVTEARSAEEALEVLATDSFHAMVLDLRLPGMDGMELLAKLRREDGRPHPPVIVASAHASGESEQQALALGCHAYLTKPLSVTELAAKLHEVVEPGV